MDKQIFTTLLEKYLKGAANESERQLLEEYFQRLQKEEAAGLQELLQSDALRQKMFSNIRARTTPATEADVIPLRRHQKWRIAGGVAAALAIAVVSGYLLIRKSPPTNPASPLQVAARPVVLHPGSDKAVLTLSDGKQVELDSTTSLALTDRGSNLSLADNRLSYRGGHNPSGSTPAGTPAAGENFNSLSTPKGGQYQLLLSDGTRVWLNAASTIRYPVTFTGDNRTVELKGEGYFEVAQNKSKPFFVRTGNMRVEVLGTHFNVMAYDDEPSVTTTLLEGSVRLQAGEQAGLLRPGQQGRLSANDDELHIGSCDTSKAVAWKDGLFRFKGDDIKTIMRQLKRWYDVDVDYAGSVSSKKYSGTISKYVDASEVFRILNLAGISFKQHGKTITVTQNPI